jgi:subtilisin family serine protease
VSRFVFIACALLASVLVFFAERKEMATRANTNIPGMTKSLQLPGKALPISPAFSQKSTSNFTGARQLSTTILPDNLLGLPADLDRRIFSSDVPKEIPGRRIPVVIPFSELDSPSLQQHAIPLPQANTLSDLNYRERRFGRIEAARGKIVLFNPEIVLVKFKDAEHVAALRVEPGDELRATRELARRGDVEFSDLDVFETRESFPDDPLITNQWQHQMIGSFEAWKISEGRSSVRIAIVDTPFQMDHPDLAAHVADGWDADLNMPVTNSSGIDHSTFCAGMAAAIINNDVGVAGAGNCTIVPININGSISEMYDAVIWAADHDVRVVNISWTGADSDTLNTAGAYLKTKTRGVLAMAGGNDPGFLDYPNQPNIWCISMTDAADNPQSAHGAHIDFAAPGSDVFSTVTGGGYGYASGTSYATPLFCGVVAVLFSINPTLGPDDVINILKETAVDKGDPGWDMWFGWGRVDFGAAAKIAAATRPEILNVAQTNSAVRITANYREGLNYTLWRSAGLAGGNWLVVTQATSVVQSNTIEFSDPHPILPNAFYRIEADVPE